MLSPQGPKFFSRFLAFPGAGGAHSRASPSGLGLVGAPGANGAPGAPGMQGAPGSNGANGVLGANGAPVIMCCCACVWSRRRGWCAGVGVQSRVSCSGFRFWFRRAQRRRRQAFFFARTCLQVREKSFFRGNQRKPPSRTAPALPVGRSAAWGFPFCGAVGFSGFQTPHGRDLGDRPSRSIQGSMTTSQIPGRPTACGPYMWIR